MFARDVDLERCLACWRLRGVLEHEDRLEIDCKGWLDVAADLKALQR